MNKDRFQKKTIEPAVYPPPQVDDGFKNPTLGNSFIQNQFLGVYVTDPSELRFIKKHKT